MPTRTEKEKNVKLISEKLICLMGLNRLTGVLQPRPQGLSSYHPLERARLDIKD